MLCSGGGEASKVVYFVILNHKLAHYVPTSESTMQDIFVAPKAAVR